jgi:hypothetical protein
MVVLTMKVDRASTMVAAFPLDFDVAKSPPTPIMPPKIAYCTSSGTLRIVAAPKIKVCGSFALMVGGQLPGDPEVEQSVSLEGVFEWLRECPEQIERAVYRSSPVFFVRSII